MQVERPSDLSDVLQTNIICVSYLQSLQLTWAAASREQEPGRASFHARAAREGSWKTPNSHQATLHTGLSVQPPTKNPISHFKN